jgi:RAD54-like protein 2
LLHADIVEISSAESDDENADVVLVPENSLHRGLSDDFGNSGSHVIDSLNCPDALGRVLVNVGHPPDEQDIFLNPCLATVVKRHQVAAQRS